MHFTDTHTIEVKVGNFTPESEMGNFDKIIKLSDWDGEAGLEYCAASLQPFSKVILNTQEKNL